MPRKTRVNPPGIPRHVTQHGNNLEFSLKKPWRHASCPKINVPDTQGANTQGFLRLAVDYAIDAYTPMAYILP